MEGAVGTAILSATRRPPPPECNPSGISCGGELRKAFGRPATGRIVTRRGGGTEARSVSSNNATALNSFRAPWTASGGPRRAPFSSLGASLRLAVHSRFATARKAVPEVNGGRGLSTIRLDLSPL